MERGEPARWQEALEGVSILRVNHQVGSRRAD